MIIPIKYKIWMVSICLITAIIIGFFNSDFLKIIGAFLLGISLGIGLIEFKR